MIPSSFYYKFLQKCCHVKTSQEHGSNFGISGSAKKAYLPAIRITEQPILLTKSKTNHPGYKFSKYFHQKRTVKSRTPPRPRI